MVFRLNDRNFLSELIKRRVSGETQDTFEEFRNYSSSEKNENKTKSTSDPRVVSEPTDQQLIEEVEKFERTNPGAMKGVKVTPFKQQAVGSIQTQLPGLEVHKSQGGKYKYTTSSNTVLTTKQKQVADEIFKKRQEFPSHDHPFRALEVLVLASPSTI